MLDSVHTHLGWGGPPTLYFVFSNYEHFFLSECFPKKSRPQYLFTTNSILRLDKYKSMFDEI